MKRLILIAGLALAACAEAEEPAPEETVQAEPVADLAPDGGPVAGTYDVTGPDGTTYRQTVNQDGTVSTTGPDGEVIEGTYTGGGNGAPFCVTQPNEEGVTETSCYNEAIVDGVWTGTNTDDPEDVWTVERVS